MPSHYYSKTVEVVIFLPKYQPIYDCRLHWGIKKGEGRKTVHSWLLETPADTYFNILNYTLVSWNKPHHPLKYQDQMEAYYFHSLPVSASLQPACEVYSSGCRTSLTISPLEWTQTPCAEEQPNYFSVHSRKQSSRAFQVSLRWTFSSQALQRTGECRSRRGSPEHILPAAHRWGQPGQDGPPAKPHRTRNPVATH